MSAPMATLATALIALSSAALADPPPPPIATDLGMPVCNTLPPGDTSTRVVIEQLRFFNSPINFFCDAKAQLQPDDNPAQPTYRWQCGGPADGPYFDFYLRGLTEAGKLLDLSFPATPPPNLPDFDSRSPNMALFLKSPISSADVNPSLLRLAVIMSGTTQHYQSFPVARVVLTEHRPLGRRGKLGELRFVRGCAEFNFKEASEKTARGEQLAPGYLRFFFQGELEDFVMKPKTAEPRPPSAVPTPSS